MRQIMVLAFAAALVASGCGDDSTPSAPTPTTPNITESFSGTLTQNGGVTHTFVTARPGSVTATLVAVAPNNTAVVGLSLGTWNGNACSIVIAKDNAVQSSAISGTVGGAGPLCVRVYDVGRLTGAITYQVDVIHP